MKLQIVQFLSIASALVQLDFDIYYGDSVADIHHKRNQERGYISKRDDIAQMTLHNQQTWYLSDLYFGSNQDKISVLVDTGSSDLWIHSHDVICKVIDPDATGGSDMSLAQITSAGDVTNTCTSHGSFNTADSDSFQRNETESAFYLSYGDKSYALGIWGYDTVGFGDSTNDTTKIDNLSFGVANITNSEMGVLGIGLIGLETSDESYENFPLKMQSQGLIKKNAYSLYLNSQNSNSGSILFGAVDHDKYEGQLQTVQLVSTYPGGQMVRLTVALSGMNFINGNSNITLFENTNYAALLDSGTTFSYFGEDVLNAITTTLDAIFSEEDGLYVVPCTTDPDLKIEFNFNGVIIQVPLIDLIVTDEDRCILTILPELGDVDQFPLVIIGNNVLRSGYFVFDLDSNEVSMAQAKYSNESDIEEIESSVPSAIKAADYSSTALFNGSTSFDVSAISYPSTGTTTRSSNSSAGSSGVNRSTSGISTTSSGNASETSSENNGASGSKSQWISFSLFIVSITVFGTCFI